MSETTQGKKYMIALDQGTTSSRTVLIDHDGTCVDEVRREFGQIYPKPGWVEHNPQEILFSQLGSFAELLTKHALSAKDIVGIGITNQRETTIVWDRATGEPIANAIVWQCRRTAPIIEELCGNEGVAQQVVAKTGLHPDAYFSASKIKWLLDNVEGARERAARRTAVWHRRLLACLEPDRRQGARDRRHQREPHHALQHLRGLLG